MLATLHVSVQPVEFLNSGPLPGPRQTPGWILHEPELAGATAQEAEVASVAEVVLLDGGGGVAARQRPHVAGRAARDARLIQRHAFPAGEEVALARVRAVGEVRAGRVLVAQVAAVAHGRHGAAGRRSEAGRNERVDGIAREANSAGERAVAELGRRLLAHPAREPRRAVARARVAAAARTGVSRWRKTKEEDQEERS